MYKKIPIRVGQMESLSCVDGCSIEVTVNGSFGEYGKDPERKKKLMNMLENYDPTLTQEDLEWLNGKTVGKELI